MTLWTCLSDLALRMRDGAVSGLSTLVESVRGLVEGDPALRRRVAFSVAVIALSAKMAKADGVVTPDETRVFHQLFAVPAAEARNVARLYDLARGDVAGFEAYAQRLASLCVDEADCDEAGLENVLDALFQIAVADGLLHERESAFLERVSGIFGLSQGRYEALLARHVDRGEADPWTVLGVPRGAPADQVRRRYRSLVMENHPDRVIAQGLPPEFVVVATKRLAAINAAYEAIERDLALA